MNRLLILFCLGILCSGCGPDRKREQVVLYTSQDQVYAEPILKEFTAETGIEVRPVFDSESAKTAGLAHRLRFEADNPICDVFWSNEELHTRMLVRDKVLKADWKSIGYRTRRLVLNTNLVQLDKAPRSLLELTNSAWHGKVAVAYPLFGTTGVHFLALRHHWGEESWKRWCHGLVRNAARVVDGNSIVVKLVGAGEAAIGLTDSDDVLAGQKQGMPIIALPIGPETLAVPNTVALVNGAPNSENAESLLQFLSRPSVLSKLIDAGALEGPELDTVRTNTLQVDWTNSIQEFQDAATFLRFIFTRS